MHRVLAIDIGASGGRHILGELDDGRIRLTEVHRFPNGMVRKGGMLCWDLGALFAEVITGLQKCAALGTIPESVGIDTWGVDFVLLDKEGQLLGDAVAYRDSRTQGMDAEVYKRIPEAELYARAGIQKQPFNTIFQLMAVKIQNPQLLDKAACLLLIPDYLHYLLCGTRATEYTIASTTGLLGAASRDWDGEIIRRCGFPAGIFQNIRPSGSEWGRLTSQVRDAVGFDCRVVAPPSHDTASAFLSVPAQSDDSVFLSSGTWSLIGVERPAPDTSEASRVANFTNEGGYGYRYRYLTNIMGLWIIQSLRAEIGGGAGYPELERLARSSDYPYSVDVNDSLFFSPDSMAGAVRAACRAASHPAPESVGDMLKCVYVGLARSYAQSIGGLVSHTGRRYDALHIIGGGSRDMFLNELSAKTCALPVYAGPAEGTALGNIVSQLIAMGELPGVGAARAAIRESFDIQEVLF
ncbi:MAG: rhamnulokinase [Oscillospiraceae bacterium]|nr:rhamnulokinase [Oscillospiraceae bacterium]